jgi:Na+/proline symporter
VILTTVVILAAYLAVILAIGFRSGRGVEHNSESFFVANRHLNWLQESMAVFTTAAPAGALLGTTGLFYSAGADMLGYLIGYAFLMPLTYWYVGSRLRRLGRARGYQTQAVFLGDFFQSRYLYWGVALAGVFFSIPYFMVNPVALGILLNQYTRIPFWLGVLLFVVVSMAYCLKGGLRAVANTDIFHGFLLVLFFIVSIATLVLDAGGLHHVLDTPKAAVAVSGPGRTLFLSWIVYQGFVVICWPDRSLRMFAVRDDNNMRKGVIISGVMLSFASLSYFLIGLAVHAILPDIRNTDTALAAGLETAGVWLVPWFVMNAWGSGMSNFTAGMISVSNIFIKDIFEPWHTRRYRTAAGPQRDRVVMRATYAWMVVLALVTLGVCFYPPPFIWNLINLTMGLFLQFAPMLVLGLLWRGSTRLAAQISWTAGVALMFLWSFVLKPPVGPLAGFNALIVNTFIFVVVSLLVPEKQEVKDQREAMRILASPETEALVSAVDRQPSTVCAPG